MWKSRSDACRKTILLDNMAIIEFIDFIDFIEFIEFIDYIATNDNPVFWYLTAYLISHVFSTFITNNWHFEADEKIACIFDGLMIS